MKLSKAYMHNVLVDDVGTRLNVASQLVESIYSDTTPRFARSATVDRYNAHYGCDGSHAGTTPEGPLDVGNCRLPKPASYEDSPSVALQFHRKKTPFSAFSRLPMSMSYFTEFEPLTCALHGKGVTQGFTRATRWRFCRLLVDI